MVDSKIRAEMKYCGISSAIPINMMTTPIAAMTRLVSRDPNYCPLLCCLPAAPQIPCAQRIRQAGAVSFLSVDQPSRSHQHVLR